MNCRDCNAFLADGSKFCTYCGQTQVSPPTASPILPNGSGFQQAGSLEYNPPHVSNAAASSWQQPYVKCPQCGFSLPANAIFCTHCGGRLGYGSIAGTGQRPVANPASKPAKYRAFLFIGFLIMLIGIIVGCLCQINMSEIYDSKRGAVEAKIGTHVAVIMIFVVVSAIFFFLACKRAAGNKYLQPVHYAFVGAYLVSGISFAFASAYHARASILQDYYEHINSSPGWYSGDISDASWFRDLPDIAQKFLSTATVYYFLTCMGLVAAAIAVYYAFHKRKNIRY